MSIYCIQVEVIPNPKDLNRTTEIDEIIEELEELKYDSCAHEGHKKYYEKAKDHHRFWCSDCQNYMRGPNDTSPRTRFERVIKNLKAFKL